MSAPELSSTALAQMLRTLADRVDSGAELFEVGMETESIGHATKTTITLWALPNPQAVLAEIAARRVAPWSAQPAGEPQWCTRLIAVWNGPDRLCNTMLHPDGTCPKHPAHRRAATR